MNSNNAALIVPPAVSDLATNDIRGIRPPVEIPNEWAWLWWVLAVVALAAVAAILYVWMQRKAAAVTPVKVIPPHVRARQLLDAALRFIHDPRQFCILVSDAVRLYLEERFQFHAPEQTTEEFLFELQRTDRLLHDQKLSLAAFLEVCDLVKFARLEPNESALRELHEAAMRLIDETQDYGFAATPSLAPAGSSSDVPPPPPPQPPALMPPPVLGAPAPSPPASLATTETSAQQAQLV